MNWGFYELLRPAQIEAVREKAPIAYIPWGALEWHSYHNPIGLDGLKARGLCEALAQETDEILSIHREEDAAICRHTLRYGEAKVAGRQRLWPFHIEIVLLEAMLVGDFDGVAKPFGDDQSGAGARAFDERVGGQCGAVDHQPDFMG